MTVKELIDALSKIKNKKQPVYFPDRARLIGNITCVDVVEQSSLGFFGKKIPCIMLRELRSDEHEEEK